MHIHVYTSYVKIRFVCWLQGLGSMVIYTYRALQDPGFRFQFSAIGMRASDCVVPVRQDVTV